MSYQWTDVADIAEALFDQYPEVDPKSVRFTDLHRWVCGLDDFDGDFKRSNERILEAIQLAWIKESD